MAFIQNKNSFLRVGNNYYPDIDGLRAIAIIGVVLYHFFPSLLRGGFFGVDIFFAISGFLITKFIFDSTKAEPFKILDFFARRIKRIFPSLLLVLIICLVFGWFVLFPHEYLQLSKYILSGVGFSANLIALSEVNYFDASAYSKPLLNLWSLGVEEQFYIIYPIALYFIQKYTPKKIGFFLIISFIISFIIWVLLSFFSKKFAFYLPISRFWEFLSGGLIAYFLPNKRNFSFYNLSFSYLGLFVIFLPFIFFREQLSVINYLIYTILSVLGSCLILYTSLIKNKSLLSNKYVRYIGLISYPIYLWHFPILSFALIISQNSLTFELKLLFFLVSFLLGALTFHFIESPIRSFNTKFFTRRLLSLSLVVFCIAFYIFRGHGIEGRNNFLNFTDNSPQLLRTENTDENCLKYLKGHENLFSYCRFNNLNSEKTIALIGDSHAHAAYPGIAAYLGEKKINTLLLANSNCLPFVDAEYGNSLIEKNYCRKSIKSLLKIIREDPHIYKIFIFSRGTQYFTGNGFGDAEKNEMLNTPLISYKDFFNSLQKTVNYLNSNGKSVLYVSENPELGILPSACLSRPFNIKKNGCLLPTKEVVLSRQYSYVQGLKLITNAKIINVIDFFCPSSSCNLFYKDKLLYADDDHLSVFGSFYQAEFIIKNELN